MAEDRLDYYFNIHSNAKCRYEEQLVVINLSVDAFSIQENEVELSKDFI